MTVGRVPDLWAVIETEVNARNRMEAHSQSLEASLFSDTDLAMIATNIFERLYQGGVNENVNRTEYDWFWFFNFPSSHHVVEARVASI